MVPQESQRPLSLRFEPLFSRTKGVPRAAPHCACLPSRSIHASPPTHRQSHQEIWAALPFPRGFPDGPRPPPSIPPSSAQISHPCAGCDRGTLWPLPVTSGTVSLGRPRYLAICQQQSALQSTNSGTLSSSVRTVPSSPRLALRGSLFSPSSCVIHPECCLNHALVHSPPLPSPPIPERQTTHRTSRPAAH